MALRNTVHFNFQNAFVSERVPVMGAHIKQKDSGAAFEIGANREEVEAKPKLLETLDETNMQEHVLLKDS